jgi:hypothetical protein
VRVKLFHAGGRADGRTDAQTETDGQTERITKLIVAFRNSANEPKKLLKFFSIAPTRLHVVTVSYQSNLTFRLPLTYVFGADIILWAGTTGHPTLDLQHRPDIFLFSTASMPLRGPTHGEDLSQGYGVKLSTQLYLVLRLIRRGDVPPCLHSS